MILLFRPAILQDVFRQWRYISNEAITIHQQASDKNKLSAIQYLELLTSYFGAMLALAIVLGKLYSTFYYQKLGLPFSAVRLGVLDYAIASPDLTVACVMILLSGILTFIMGGPASRLVIQDRVPPKTFGMGWLIVLTLSAFVVVRINAIPTGFAGFVIGTLLALSLFLGSIASDTQTELKTPRPARSGVRQWIRSQFGRIKSKLGLDVFLLTTEGRRLLAVTILLVYAVLLMLVLTWVLGQTRAVHDFNNAPIAVIHLTTEADSLFDEMDAPVRVLMVDAESYYVTTVDASIRANKSAPITVIPRSSVTHIIYNSN